jgi:flagellar motor switch protein FliN/FliY
MNPATDTATLASTAARSAAELVPSSTPLTAGAPQGADQALAGLPAGAVSVRAAVVAARRGTITIIAEAALVEALASSPIGPLPLSEALRPALEAAAAAFGAAALADVEEVAAELALREVAATEHAVVPLLADGVPAAWIAVTVAALPREAPGAGRPASAAGFEMLQDVVMELTAELGRTKMSVRDLLSLQPGAVVELDRLAGSPADLLVNGRLIARGEVVVVDEDYALRITELVAPAGGDAA